MKILVPCSKSVYIYNMYESMQTGTSASIATSIKKGEKKRARRIRTTLKDDGHDNASYFCDFASACNGKFGDLCSRYLAPPMFTLINCTF